MSTDGATTCPVCDSPMERGYCWTCDQDARDARREHHAWREYVSRHSEQMGAIATAAQRVCTEDELELLGAELLEWSEDRTAGYFGIAPDEVGARREAVHAKIRSAIARNRSPRCRADVADRPVRSI